MLDSCELIPHSGYKFLQKNSSMKILDMLEISQMKHANRQISMDQTLQIRDLLIFCRHAVIFIDVIRIISSLKEYHTGYY